MSKSKQNKGISRIDSGSTHGWFVRAYKNGKTYSKLFSDRKCGTKALALHEAKKYQSSLEKELEQIPQKPRARRVVLSDSRNKTGVLGVSKTTKKSSSGRVIECFSVSWRPESGVQKCTSFSIGKYGKREAFRLAVALRREKMAEIHGGGVHRKLKNHKKHKAQKEAEATKKTIKKTVKKKATKKVTKKAVTKKKATKKKPTVKKTTKKRVTKKAPKKTTVKKTVKVAKKTVKKRAKKK